jgi:hypothetical protein
MNGEKGSKESKEDDAMSRSSKIDRNKEIQRTASPLAVLASVREDSEASNEPDGDACRACVADERVNVSSIGRSVLA